MKNNIAKIIKYIYISTNILLALYILVNTSFLQTTLYKYVAEQNGLTKTEHITAVNQQKGINLQPSHINKIEHNESSKPFDASEIYFLLAVLSSVQLFSPKDSKSRRTLKETFSFFRRFIPLVHRFFCIGGISLRAPPSFA